jgi:ATP-binding cassette subfamily B protein
MQGTTMIALYRLWRYMQEERKWIILGIAFSTINKIFDIWPEILIGIAIDVVANHKTSIITRIGITQPLNQLIFIGVLTFVVFVGESVTEFIQSIIWRKLSQKMQAKLRLDAYDNVQKQDLTFFEKKKTGELVTVLTEDINQLERFFDWGINEFIQLIVGSIAIGAIFFYFVPSIAAITLIPIPIIWVTSYFFRKLLQPRYRNIREKAGQLTSHISNNIMGIMTIKSYATESYEYNKIHEQANQYREANERVIRVSASFTPTIRIIIAFGLISTLVLGGWYALNGHLALGVYSMLVFQTQRLLWPFTKLGILVDLYERAMASSRRIFEIIQTPIKLKKGEKKLPSSSVRGAISFQNVSFDYSAHGAGALHDITFDIKPKKTVAFVGPSGSGKSTIIKLLLRFYEPTQGSVHVDGINVHDIDTDDLRKSIGFVSQDIFLFHGTIKKNIAYGKHDASLDDIKKAAQAAQADAFIQALPHGYDTIISEQGKSLSGGQRQRIAIARALLKNPPIYIFDEATSAVDNATESHIQEALMGVFKNHTSIIIAHRLSTIVHADKIFVLDEGSIVEAGSHNELLAQHGLYYDLWRDMSKN